MTARPAAPLTSVDQLVSDPHAFRSWFLESSTLSTVDIAVEAAWRDYTGRGVSVGVLDAQIDHTHDELAHAWDATRDWNFALGSGEVRVDPKTLADGHGTLVAGVIAAAGGNGRGSVGIAPGATLVGFGIDYSDPDVGDHVRAGLAAAAALDIVNNSWSFTRNFHDNFARPEMAASGETLRATATEGRDGLGTVIVFSAGNGGATGASNYHNYQNSPYVIAVGAVAPSGDAWEDTSLGANVLLSAPGRNVFTTLPNDRFASATGTSFAAPAVSAAVALMLEANPGLGYRDVQQILALSARRDILGQGAEAGLGWIETGIDTRNGGGGHFSDSFGFGYLDVHDAVRLAETWTAQRTAATLDTLAVDVPGGQDMVAGRTDHLVLEIAVGQAIAVEHVQLSLDFTWRMTGNLDIFLTSPAGTRVQLVYEHPGSAYIGTIRNFAFSSVATMGESGSGTWRVDIHNRDPSATEGGLPARGVLRGAELVLHGDTGGQADDLHVYTDEFGTLYADDRDRHVLADRDGGNDTINAAAVTGDSRIDLSGAGPSRIAGVALAIATPRAFEAVVSGDGNDTLLGHDGDNLLSAGRGDDVIHLGAGDDTLLGGAGADLLVVDARFDEVTLGRGGTALTLATADGRATVEGIETFRFADAVLGRDALLRAAGLPPGDPVPPGGGGGTGSPAPGPVTPPGPGTPMARQTGTDRADVLRGDTGADHLAGAGGDDRLLGREGDDSLEGGTGDDVLRGGAGRDTLTGGAGEDKLSGEAGDDALDGGAGRDLLTGGAGTDVFLFDLRDAGAFDVIADFDAGAGDRILLTGLDGRPAADMQFRAGEGAVFVAIETGGRRETLLKVVMDEARDLAVLQQDGDHLVLA